MITEKDLSKKQLKNYKKEEKNIQADILHALNRGRISKHIKADKYINLSFDYLDGFISLRSKIVSGKKTIWEGLYCPEDCELSLNGYENQDELINIALSNLVADLGEMSGIKAINTLKKIFF